MDSSFPPFQPLNHSSGERGFINRRDKLRDEIKDFALGVFCGEVLRIEGVGDVE
jgi:hypothetical protein